MTEEHISNGQVSVKGNGVDCAAIGVDQPVRKRIAAAERKFLLDLARATLVRVAGQLDPWPSEIPGREITSPLLQWTGCFVTLFRNGALRGCVGQLMPQEPLYRAVVQNAANAASRDGRFQPVQPEEIPEIKIEISVLTEPQPLSFASPEDLLEKLRPYEDGVLLKMDMCEATFLPQVWSQMPDKEEFLNQLSCKAGRGPSDWRGKGTAVFVYRVEAFGD